jgi:hypothetical protein
MNYSKIFAAHCRSRLPLLLWGASGYGKSNLVGSFAKKNQLELEVLHAQYLDPLALFIPSTSTMEDRGYAKFFPTEAIHRILNTKKKTVLFLDELMRAREDTLNILTEMLIERKIFGYQIPSQFYIFAASSFAEEDTGVRELPDAVMNRLTHLIHAPDPKESLIAMRHPLAQKALNQGRNVIAHPAQFPVLDRLKPCPRQIDSCASLAESGLRGEDLLAVCRGRVGVETGTELAFALERAIEDKLPSCRPFLNPRDSVHFEYWKSPVTSSR